MVVSYDQCIFSNQPDGPDVYCEGSDRTVLQYDRMSGYACRILYRYVTSGIGSGKSGRTQSKISYVWRLTRWDLRFY